MSGPSPLPCVFYHAGLGKVASTYLQKSVFPALDGIHYIPRNRFRSHRRVIAAADHGRYLLSRECGKYLDRRLAEIAGFYPDARILLFFRRHDQWIASHYRRYVKNGGQLSLDRYLDLDGDDGIWKRDQLLYMKMLQKVEGYFGRPPFVLTYDGLKADGDLFNRRIAEFLGATLDSDRLRSAPVHTSYSERRLVRLRRLNRALGLPDPERREAIPGKAHRLARRLSLYRSYLLLGVAGLLPAVREPLVADATLDRIRQYYADDWKAIVEFERAQFAG